MATKEPPDCVKRAVLHVSSEFARVMTTPMGTNRQRFLEEVLAVTRAAAIGGEYRDAIKGYEVLGKALGHISDAPSQHLHLHAQGAPLTDKSDAELVAFMRNPKAGLDADERAGARLPEPTEADFEVLHSKLDEAEAEALLYA